MSEVGTNQTDIYNYIKDAYDADPDRPQYVLLVGDHENVPAYKIVGHPYYDSSYEWHTDYDYSLLEGSDKVDYIWCEARNCLNAPPLALTNCACSS